jgi:hypothetical protein
MAGILETIFSGLLIDKYNANLEEIYVEFTY